jgi:hypothetical protein
MDSASDEAKTKRKIPAYVGDLIELGVNTRVLADRHLPQPHRDRADLLEVADVLKELGHFAHNLWFTVEVIERMKRLTFGQQIDIFDMACQLKERAATCAEGSTDRQFFAHAGELMDLWHTLSGNYDTLRAASDQLRFRVHKEGKPPS